MGFETLGTQGQDGRVGSRTLLATAAAITVVSVFGTVALGTRPGAADTGAQVAAWFREHRDGVGWFVWSSTVADRLEPATARTVLDVALFFGPVLTGAFITMIAPVTL